MSAATKQSAADGKACLKAALDYLKAGWSVLPLNPPDHPNREVAGKVPWIKWKQYEDDLPTEKDVRSWWKTQPASNVGIALGPVSNLVRIDVEGAAGEEELRRKSGGIMPVTLEFRSGRADGSGRGLLYRIPEGARLKTTIFKKGDKSELRFQARGAQTVLPPSRHTSGGLYVWEEGRGPGEIEPALMPAWLLAEMSDRGRQDGAARPRRGDGDWDEIFGGVAEGARDDSATAYIGRVLASTRDLGDTAAMRALYVGIEAWNERNDPPLEAEQLQKCFRSVARMEREKRDKADLGRLDSLVAREIGAVAEANGHAGDGRPDGLPEWDLITVTSDPVTYRLRSPYWSDSPLLKDGYIKLTAEEILSWGGRSSSVYRACFDQSRKLAPMKLKEWATPGGHLEKLLAMGHVQDTVPENKRPLQILAYVYRYLRFARPVQEKDGKPSYPPSGAPVVLPDGNTIFKLFHLKKKIAADKETFRPQEVSSLLEESGFTTGQPDNTRWWMVSAATLARLGEITKEGAP